MNTVYVNQYGVKAGEDVTLPLYALMQKYPKDTTFIFDKGDYCFTPQFTYDYRLSNSDRIPERKLGIWLRGMENVKFDFSGSTLWFAGQMQPFTVDHCTHVEIANAAINWEKPLVAEGVVTAFGDGYIDMFIDPSLYPHRMQDGRLEFDTGNDEWYALCCPHSQIQFDEMSRTVRRNSGDRFSPTRVEELGGSIYRFYANDTLNTAVGNIFVLRHNARIHAGCFLEKSEDVTLTDITFYSCGGLGCLAQFCHNLTFRRVHFLPDMKRGRKVANGRDDGMHITCCSGKITITECSFTGLMDDPINVHSCCCTVSEVLDDHTIHCRYMHHQATAFHYWAEPGDKIVFIERRHMTQKFSGTVASYSLDADGNTFVLRFADALPGEILSAAADPNALAVDNLTHTAAFDCTKNRFGSCRARGILVSTPKPVRITDNYFASSGCAVLVAGDSNYWYESGECHDVEIARNVFTDVCLTSMYQFCDGIISVCPVVPEPDAKTPFHKNIRIHDNIFDTADTPVLYAFSTLGLTFTGNRIYRSPAADKWQNGASHLINLAACNSVCISDNSFIGDFTLDKVRTENCLNVILDD